MRSFCWLLLSLCLFAAHAADDPLARQKNLQKRISELVKDIDSERGRYSDLQKKLATAERRVNENARELRHVEQQLKLTASQIDKLELQEEQQLEALKKQRKLLAEHIRSAWISGNQERLQLWLSGADPSMFGPTLTWYEYLSQARAQNVLSLSEEITLLQQTRTALAKTRSELTTLRGQKSNRLDKLKMAHKLRQELLDSSGGRIRSEQQQLDKLQAEEQKLAALIKRIRKEAAKAPAIVRSNTPSKPFAKLTGQLHWPTKGRIIQDFGAPRADGRLKWQGVTIGAKAGAPVRAVAAGEVIFAEWLGRLGLLTIVDHGNDYLTLYGHNQVLYKKPGDRVAAGELIAKVGDSGGRKNSALYFEIRKGANYRNPHIWCKKAAL